MKRLILAVIVCSLIVLLACAPTPAPPPPAPTPAPSEAPEIPRAVLYSDDFSDDTSGWETFDYEDGWCCYEEGWLHILNYTYAEYGSFSRLTGKDFSDFVLEIETKLIDGTMDNWHQIACRMSAAPKTQEWSYYDFGISADGYYGISKAIGDEQIELVPASRSIHIKKGRDVVNVMRVECIGNNLRLSVNGHFLVEAQDSDLDTGWLALGVTAWKEQDGKTFSQIAFDNIVVWAP